MNISYFDTRTPPDPSFLLQLDPVNKVFQLDPENKESFGAASSKAPPPLHPSLALTARALAPALWDVHWNCI